MYPEHPSDMNQEQAHTTELRALPQITPDSDAWPFIARQLEQADIVELSWLKVRWLKPAMVAILLLSLGMITLLTQRVDEQDQMLQAWVNYSQELESDLRQLQGRNGAIRGHQAVAIGQLEDMLAIVDWQLAQGSNDEQRQLQLWQQRTTLLNDLVTVRAGQRFLPAAQQQQPVITLNRPARLVSYEL